MAGLDPDAREALNSLIEVCRDGQYGFEQAAKGVDDAALRAELIQYSMQRRDFAAALRQVLREQGEEPDDSGSVSGALHRGWINVRQAIAKSDKTAVLSECERGEDAAVSAYRDAMARPVPGGIDDLVEMQYASIRRVHDRIRDLRQTTKELH
jgi:uncharacterized protein (TIGR02284 family)